MLIGNAAAVRRLRWVAVIVMATASGCAKVERSAIGGAGGQSVPAGPDAAAPADAGSATEAARDVTGDGPRGPCVGLACQTVTCPGAPTSISGTVFAPNGKLPLYNVMVYIPSAPLEPFPAGVTCDRCGVVASGSPLVVALSNAEGKFKLGNVPAGASIPLVMQVGKWRRQVTLPSVTACQDNPLTDANLTRLPRNRKEGDLPRIAVTTGECDQLGCLLPRLGIDPAEFGVAGDDKAVAYYSGSLAGAPPAPPGGGASAYGPPNMRPAQELWNDEAALSKHDVTLLSCECSENPDTKTAASFTAMTSYLGRGGRVFSTHYSYVWFKNATDTALTGALSIVPQIGRGMSPMTIDSTFPKGKALADWMKFVDPTLTYGEIPSISIYNNVRGVMPPVATAWASSGTTVPGATGPVLESRVRIATANTPAGAPADKQCGRAAFLDAHVTMENGRLGTDMPNVMFPESCGTTMTQGETALAFLFFDLSSCVQPDNLPPIIP